MGPLLRYGDTIGIISCSDGKPSEYVTTMKSLEDVLIKLGLKIKFAETIYQVADTPFSGSPERRGQALMNFFRDPTIKAIFDISGGDSANQVLPYLDFPLITENPKPFFGISDLSVLLNGLYTRTGICNYHFKISTLVGKHSFEQIDLFNHLFLNDHQSANQFITFPYTFLRGNSLSGTVVGGNIRCFLKLAGTPYLPNPTNKLLFLESLGGGSNRTASLLAQLDQIGYFNQCNGVLLGTFTEMESKQAQPTVEELVLEITDKYQLPIVKTNQLGHGSNGHCLPIGAHIHLSLPD
ncbi:MULTISPECIES: LD-carboxypeptidase [Paraliobacillus]|uniref:S66 peptidase family protein n=1 Tax=Paraliobacillus TaxID=200903 RepID=UPI000DD31C25|nr:MULTISPECIES: S66 peptidase family protein [Paraliobacillus]